MKKRTNFAILLCLTFFAMSIVSADTVTIRPNVQGYYSQWTNSGCSSGSSEWQCVDEDPASISDYLYTSSANKFESFGFQDVSFNGAINSVTLYFYGQRYSSTRYRFQPLIRSSSTNYLGSVKTLTLNYASYSEAYTKNPATGLSWTIADVNALEAGMKSYSSTYGGKIAQVYAVVDYTTSTCTDTDGGVLKTVFGITSGLFNGVPYSNSDYCLDSTTLSENYCAGVYSYAVTMNCNQNMTTTCSDGMCI